MTSCLWDNGTPLTSDSYVNFYPGHPNLDAGSCVYLASSTGQWFSGSCTGVQAPFVCRATPGIKGVSYRVKRRRHQVTVTLCPGYSYYFRERCYLAVNALDYADAAAQCSDSCGTVASIHNDGVSSGRARPAVVQLGRGAVDEEQMGPKTEDSPRPKTQGSI